MSDRLLNPAPRSIVRRNSNIPSPNNPKANSPSNGRTTNSVNNNNNRRSSISSAVTNGDDDDPYNDISYDTVRGALQRSRVKNTNNNQLLYIQEQVKYDWQMTHNSFPQLRELNYEYLNMMGKHDSLVIRVSLLVMDSIIKPIVTHYNNHLASMARENFSSEVKSYRMYDWHSFSNELCMTMIVEWVRPNSCNDFVKALIKMLENEIPQKFPITNLNFCGFYHTKLLD